MVLPEVLDAWDERDVTPRMPGRTGLSRVADDGVVGCERPEAARRIMAGRPKHVARFGLPMHPPQTVRLSCRTPDARKAADPGDGPVELLGLTHDWARSRRGYGVIQRQTSGKRLRRAQKARWPWGRSARHTALPEPDRPVCQKRRGHDPDDGMRGNSRRLDTRCKYVAKAWR
jgi:RNA-directed DNA polymerase